jgi:hypothetical protein
LKRQVAKNAKGRGILDFLQEGTEGVNWRDFQAGHWPGACAFEMISAKRADAEFAEFAEGAENSEDFSDF